MSCVGNSHKIHRKVRPDWGVPCTSLKITFLPQLSLGKICVERGFPNSGQLLCGLKSGNRSKERGRQSR